MKKIFLSLLTIPLFTFAQTPEGYHEHDGFFLSMNTGIGAGPVVLNASGTSFKKMEVSGTGLVFDFKIGGTIAKTLSLSCDIIGRTVPNPTITTDGKSTSLPTDMSSNDQLVGLGLTYYFMPANFFLNGTVGFSTFSFKNTASNTTSSSDNGFGLQFKIGKEWWTGNNWGLGISSGFSYLGAKDKAIPGSPNYSGDISTGKFFIMFNTTYN